MNPDFSLAVQAPLEDDIIETWEQYELFFETKRALFINYVHFKVQTLPLEQTLDEKKISYF